MSLELGVLVADACSAAAAVDRANQLAAPENTHFFVMSTGVRALAALRESANRGAEVTVCATDAATWNIDALDWPSTAWGSQYDHGYLLRNAPRFLADTGAHQCYLAAPADVTRVAVEITRPPSDVLSDQALRTAIAYLGCDLQVTVFSRFEQRFDDAPLAPETQKKIHFLRSRQAFVVGDSPLAQQTYDRWITW